MSTISDFVRIEAMSLPVGETLTNRICPSCGGGSSREESLAITRYPDKIAYICYRDSCDVRGYVDDFGNTNFRHDKHLKEQSKRKVRPYEGSLLPLELGDKEYFEERFDIPYWASSYLAKIGTGGLFYVFPIRNWESRIVGHVLRQPKWKGKPEPVRLNLNWDGPKALTRMKEEAEPLAFYKSSHDNASKRKCILVEDQVSAAKLMAYGYNAVALLSTNLNLAKVRDIQRAGYSEIIIALDKDATNTAFKLAKQYGLAFNKCKVAILSQDPKDYSVNEFPLIFGEN